MQSGGVSATKGAGGSISVTADRGYAGTARIAYTVQDAAERTADGVLEVFVWGLPTAPGAPTEVKDGTTATSAKLTWAGSEANAFSSDPEARQLTYRVDYAGGSKECPDTSCTVGGLTPGTSYTFTVTAINAVGESPASRPSAPIVPDALPAAPAFQPLSGNRRLRRWDRGARMEPAHIRGVANPRVRAADQPWRQSGAGCVRRHIDERDGAEERHDLPVRPHCGERQGSDEQRTVLGDADRRSGRTWVA